jgi:hypothetical protein
MTTSPRTEPAPGLRPSTPMLAIVGASAFVSGFFLLAVAGRDLGSGVYLLVLAGALVLTAPVALLSFLVASAESAVGRAWAAGWRRLAPEERTRRATGRRGLRYAGFLWLANGGALWFAALASQF